MPGARPGMTWRGCDANKSSGACGFYRLCHRGWRGNLHTALLRQQVARLRAAGPADDLEAAVEVLDHGGAALDPVAAVDVAAAGIIPDDRMMDMTADDAVDAVPPGFGRDCLLVMADEVDSVLDLQLGPLRQRPVRKAKLTPNDVERCVAPDRDVIGLITKQRQPARMANHHVEQIAVNDEIALAVGRDMDGALQHLNATEMGAVIVAQELVVIARDIDDAHALACLTQQLLHDVVMSLRPVPARPQFPAVHDVADQIDRFGLMIAQEVDQFLRLATAPSEMDVGQEHGSKLSRAVVGGCKHWIADVTHPSVLADFYCGSMTLMRFARGQRCASAYCARQNLSLTSLHTRVPVTAGRA